MNQILINSFNQWIAWALQDLDRLPDLPAEIYPISRRVRIESAEVSLRHALQRANELGCPARKAMCLCVLNWLRAGLRRLPA